MKCNLMLCLGSLPFHEARVAFHLQWKTGTVYKAWKCSKPKSQGILVGLASLKPFKKSTNCSTTPFKQHQRKALIRLIPCIPFPNYGEEIYTKSLINTIFSLKASSLCWYFQCQEAQILIIFDLCITKDIFLHLVLKDEQNYEVYVSGDKLQHEDPLCWPKRYAPSAIGVPFQIMPVYTQNESN